MLANWSVCLLVAAACGGNGESDAGGEPADTTEETTTEAEPTTSEEAPAEPLIATLQQGYKVEGGANVAFENSELPVPPGKVRARWYRSGGKFVVVYTGVPASAKALCPGNSLESGGSFSDISNSPVEPGACKGASKLASTKVQTCGGRLVYVTEIPADSTGTLYASIERYEGKSITGVTGPISISAGEAPEVELSELGC